MKTTCTCKILPTSQVNPGRATVHVETPHTGTLVYEFARGRGEKGADLLMVAMECRPGQRVPHRDGYSAVRRLAIKAMDDAARAMAEQTERVQHEAALRRAGGIPPYIKTEEA